MSLTSAQQAAVAARGNVLVVAGAGTGKTSALVERCLNILLAEQPRVSLDEILMVTFTEAAAADMRRRIRQRLETEAETCQARPASAADLQHLREQLALFETAHMGTLHSFCFQLVRQHFYELGLDPQITVLAEEEARLLAQESLDELFQKHYAGGTRNATAVQELIEVQGSGRDQSIRALVLRLHHYSQTRPDPAGWLDQELAGFAVPLPQKWERWLAEALGEWREASLGFLERLAASNHVAHACFTALRGIKLDTPQPGPDAGVPGMMARPTADEGREAANHSEALKTSECLKVAAALKEICSARENCPQGRKTAWNEPLKRFFTEAEFFASLLPGEASGTPSIPDISPAKAKTNSEAPTGRTPEPLAEDWEWTRGQMTTLLELAREFEAKFSDAKRELGVVDFHDLEQHALRLLWDTRANQPTPIARHWRKQFRFVFVDEYQDINAAQDKIIEALSRDHPEANRFLVGDVKQSIYRFRLADPSIFQRYARIWAPGRSPDAVLDNPGRPSRVIPLVENFRSRERILNFINSLFGTVMRPEVGGVDYNDEARLHFGAPQQRQALSAAADASPRVELSMRIKRGKNAALAEGDHAEVLAELGDLEEADKEARSVAIRLREMKAQQHPIWDETAKQFRPVEWSDIAILLRAPSSKSERYAKEFARSNIPLQVARGGFYEGLEISDLLSLLRTLDNPLQDLPLLAVLHSPLVGLTLDELATVRLAAKGPFWAAVASITHYSVFDPPTPASTRSLSGSNAAGEDTLALLNHKIRTFLDRFARWRRLARQGSLSRCLEAVLAETHYSSWLRSQPGGEQRYANLQRLLALARDFDQFQRQGLFRFLRFVEAQQNADTEPESAPVSEENSVRLMSIHQSKGLEFPVVVLADLGKPFNVSDLRADVILDEKYGLCPQIMPPRTGARYPSLPYWLASRRQHREMLGEELRLLYVGMTRARDTLLLSATVSASRFDKVWATHEDGGELTLSRAGSFADWLGMWFSRNASGSEGQNDLLSWAVRDDAELILPVPAEPSLAGEALPSLAPAEWEKLQKRLTWHYPFTGASGQAAKIRVSEFARRAGELPDRESWEALPPKGEWIIKQEAGKIGKGSSTAAEIGSAHHLFLEFVSLDRVGSVEELLAEARRLEQLGTLTAEQIAELDLEGVAAFWTSSLGQEIRSQKPYVRRELAFTARFSLGELGRLTGLPANPGVENELIVAEGKADLAIILPQEIRLLDFKTDRVQRSQLPERAKLYSAQLELYARALSQIYRRPVTERWLYFLRLREALRV